MLGQRTQNWLDFVTQEPRARQSAGPESPKPRAWQILGLGSPEQGSVWGQRAQIKAKCGARELKMQRGLGPRSQVQCSRLRLRPPATQKGS